MGRTCEAQPQVQCTYKGGCLAVVLSHIKQSQPWPFGILGVLGGGRTVAPTAVAQPIAAGRWWGASDC
eukprot:6907040-Prymnesium_polylepis.1